jgi:N-acetylneuraminate synthase
MPPDVSEKDRLLFENLFVLEAANNHWGDLVRGKKIVQDFAAIIRGNNVKAAIKFQFRDVENFIHKDFKGNAEVRYISKTEATRMTHDQYAELAQAVRNVGCIPMATPFDESSVDLCVKLDLPILKVASSDINDWPLIEKIAHTKLPVIISSGGASEKSLDDVVQYFEKRNISLAINHCVSLYPSEDEQLELNQIEYLRDRYPNHVIGFSSHEYSDWAASMYISYAKGARTWERHIDIEYGGVPVSKYCSLPQQVDTWFKAFHKAREMSGSSAYERRHISNEEVKYLDALIRGIYARRDLAKGHVIDSATFAQDFKLAVPLLRGQLSTREVLNGTQIIQDIKADQAVTVDHIDGPYGTINELRDQILERGL